MNKQSNIHFVLVVTLFVFFIFTSSYANAQSQQGTLTETQSVVDGPGECTSREECRTYCALEENRHECVLYAMANGIISQRVGRQALVYLEGGPEDCTSPNECRTVCKNSENTQACISFAERLGVINTDHASRLHSLFNQSAKMLAKKALEKEPGPGGCTTLGECHEFCEDSKNAELCLFYARDNKIISDSRARSIERRYLIHKLLQSQKGPGDCQNARECYNYCQDQNHQQECFDFAGRYRLLNEVDIRRGIEQLTPSAVDRAPDSFPGKLPDNFQTPFYRSIELDYKERRLEQLERLRTLPSKAPEPTHDFNTSDFLKTRQQEFESKPDADAQRLGGDIFNIMRFLLSPLFR